MDIFRSHHTLEIKNEDKSTIQKIADKIHLAPLLALATYYKIGEKDCKDVKFEVEKSNKNVIF